MSIPLGSIDLTNATVGQIFKIDTAQVAQMTGGFYTNPSQIGTVRIYNESGCGFRTVTKGGNSYSADLIGGGVLDVPVSPGTSEIDLTVQYILPNAPVKILMPTFYAANEPLPAASMLGNSPIGISGSVATSSVQTLSNETSPPTPVLVIDVGNTINADLITIYNDGTFSWSVAGHTLLQGSIANLLQLGKAGDITSVLGKLNVAQLITASAGITVSASGLSVVGGITNDTLTESGLATFNGEVDLNSSVKPSPSTVVAAGNPTSGSATLYSIWTGVVKLYLIVINNYQTSATAGTIVFPVAFTTGCLFVVTDTNGYLIKSSGSNVTLNIMTTTQNSTSQTSGASWDIISFIHAADTLSFNGGASAAHNGFFLMIGV